MKTPARLEPLPPLSESEKRFYTVTPEVVKDVATKLDGLRQGVFGLGSALATDTRSAPELVEHIQAELLRLYNAST